MIKSMTGYGKAEAVLSDRKFMLEMKSVNHRFLEISLRLPGMLLPLEGEFKRRIGEQFSRGRIEATLRMDGDGSAEILFVVNHFAGPLSGERGKLVAWRPAIAPEKGQISP